MSDEITGGPTADAGSGNSGAKWPALATLTFLTGDYNHAICCWRAAQGWILDNGLADATDIAGVLNHPVHPESPLGDKHVPAPLLGLAGWETTIDLWCDDQLALDRLLAIPLPPQAALVDEDGKPFRSSPMS